jgi:glycosyltransferase involved in cell wall biosynthesis
METPLATVVIPYRPQEHPFRVANCQRVERHLSDVLPGCPIILADDGRAPFSRACSINEGVKEAETEVVIISDADVIVHRGQLERAIDLANDGHPGLIIPFERYLYLTKGESRRIVSTSKLPFRPAVEWTMGNSVGPCVVVRRDSFLKIKGYDPRFRGWGFEDVAFNDTALTVLGPTHRIPGDLWHLWHPVDKTNNTENPHYQANLSLCQRYVAAKGDPGAMMALRNEAEIQHATG